LIAQAQALGARVSLFMDADASAMAGAKAVGADRVELYTEPYAAAWGTPDQANQLQRFAAAAQAALDAGLGVNAGHDLNRDNLAAFAQRVPGLREVSIGHALIADALEFGLVNRVVPPSEANALARRQALKLAAKPLPALMETKRLMKKGQLAQVLAQIAEEGATFGRLLQSPHAKEAFSAFLEKRKPDFSAL
jgi:hypothetical protein